MHKELSRRAAPVVALLMALGGVSTSAAILCGFILGGTRSGDALVLTLVLGGSAWLCLGALAIRHLQICRRSLALEELTGIGLMGCGSGRGSNHAVAFHKRYRKLDSGAQEIFKTLVSDSHLTLRHIDPCTEALEASVLLSRTGDTP